MNTPLFTDRRTSDLLARVNEDVSLLSNDLGRLLSHTAHHTLPAGARELADSAKAQISSGKEFTSAQLRALRDQVSQSPMAWLGGAAAVGILAAGIYWFSRDRDEDDELEEMLEPN